MSLIGISTFICEDCGFVGERQTQMYAHHKWDCPPKPEVVSEQWFSDCCGEFPILIDDHWSCLKCKQQAGFKEHKNVII